MTAGRMNGISTLLNSVEAERGATDLVRKIEEGKLTMDILPNTFPRFSGKLEEDDYISFGKFLKSINGKRVLRMLEEEDARKFVEL